MKNKQKNTLKQQRLEKERQARRELIIEGAQTHFMQYGYEATKIDDIAAQVGYTKATLYNYFDSKNDLFAAVLSRFYRNMAKFMTHYISEHENIKGIRTLCNGYLAFVEKYPTQVELMDSGRCTIINRKIIEKLEHQEPLSDSELEFRQNEDHAAEVMKDILIPSIQNQNILSSDNSIKILKALNVLNLTIRELVKQETLLGKSREETNEILSILITIIEKGIEHYESS